MPGTRDHSSLSPPPPQQGAQHGEQAGAGSRPGGPWGAGPGRTWFRVGLGGCRTWSRVGLGGCGSQALSVAGTRPLLGPHAGSAAAWDWTERGSLSCPLACALWDIPPGGSPPSRGQVTGCPPTPPTRAFSRVCTFPTFTASLPLAGQWPGGPHCGAETPWSTLGGQSGAETPPPGLALSTGEETRRVSTELTATRRRGPGRHKGLRRAPRLPARRVARHVWGGCRPVFTSWAGAPPQGRLDRPLSQEPSQVPSLQKWEPK